MAIVIEIFLICDGGCGNNYGVDTRNYTSKQQREAAKRNGWVTVGRKDYCPECKPMKYMSPREKTML